MPSTNDTSSALLITPEQMLRHWQGHRALTRRIIDAFPEKDLMNYSIGGMRTMLDYAVEFLGMGVPTLQGVVTRVWPSTNFDDKPATKAELLSRWDAATEEINRLWSEIPPERFQETDKAFGQWEMPVHALLLYIIDNEIHHRGQGYVYLRALGIEPPPFYERG